MVGVKTQSKHFRLIAICCVVIAIGFSLFILDDVYGPKDQIIYAWPFAVLLIMIIAAVVAAFSSFLVLWRYVRT
jgi:hypothetical protein